jgi:ferrochelatase
MVEHWPHGPVEIAMRYGQPALPDVLERLAAQGVRKVTLAPLYPQFADSTVTTVVELAKQTVSERQLPLQMRVLQPFYEHPAYIEALAASARPYLETGYDHLCCRLLPRCTCRSTFGLLSRAMPGHGQSLCAENGHT